MEALHLCMDLGGNPKDLSVSITGHPFEDLLLSFSNPVPLLRELTLWRLSISDDVLLPFIRRRPLFEGPILRVQNLIDEFLLELSQRATALSAFVQISLLFHRAWRVLIRIYSLRC